jgi:hypothetical protein
VYRAGRRDATMRDNSGNWFSVTQPSEERVTSEP